MDYLVRKTRSGRAHVWLGTDTLCRMASTGGLNTRRYLITSDKAYVPVCTMCRKVAAAQGIYVPPDDNKQEDLLTARA